MNNENNLTNYNLIFEIYYKVAHLIWLYLKM